MPDWLWQGLAVNAIWLIGGLIVSVIGGWVMGLLKLRQSPYAGPVLYGLAGFALTAIIIIFLTAPFRAQQTASQLAKIEAKIPDLPTTPPDVMRLRAWLDAGGYPSKMDEIQGKELFRLLVDAGDVPFSITQEKGSEGILKISSNLVANDDVEQMEKPKLDQLKSILAIDLLLLGVEWSSGIDKTTRRTQFTISHSFPIDSATTKLDFLRSVFLIKRGAHLIKKQTELFKLQRGL